MTGEKSRLAAFLPYRLSITSNAVSQRIAVEYRAQFDLKQTEWRVMAVLGDVGPLTQRQLVGATFMDKVAVNRACKVLVDGGLIMRNRNTDDGRSHLLELTEEGASVHARVMPLALQMESEILSCLSAKERKEFSRTLDKLFAQVRDMDAESCPED